MNDLFMLCLISCDKAGISLVYIEIDTVKNEHDRDTRTNEFSIVFGETIVER